MLARCRRCSAEIPGGTNRCPSCRAFQAERSDWAPDPERCPEDVEERLWKRLGTCNFISFLLVITGLGMLTQVVPAFGPRGLQVNLFGTVTLADVIPPAGAVLFALGLGFGARAKGRSVLWGFLGLLGCFGFIFLHYLGKTCQYCAEKV